MSLLYNSNSSDDSDDNISLIKNNNIYDKYNLIINEDTNNSNNNNKKFILEFNDLLYIYNNNNKLIYEISYYKIQSWEYNNIKWGFKYLTYDNEEYKLSFKTNDAQNIIHSLKKKINELIDMENITDKL
jgi:hypothetical protein